MDISSVLETIENDGRVYSFGLASGAELVFLHSQPTAIVFRHFRSVFVLICLHHVCILTRSGLVVLTWSRLTHTQTSSPTWDIVLSLTVYPSIVCQDCD